MKFLTLRKYKIIISSALFILLLLALWIIYSPYGAQKHLAIQNESKLISTEIIQLQEDNIKIQEEIDKIKDNSVYLEDVARRQYGLLKKNELVFDFSSKKGQKK